VQQNRAELTIEGNFGESDKDLVEALTKDIKDAVASVSDAEVKIGIARGVGASMGEIVNVGKLEGDGEVTVKHEAGQVILLDFWATWCPPCQEPMAHNQEMLTHNKEKWGDKVRIIGLSID
jgi:thiol-disulfide isomerase/thioredoxin